MDATGVTILPLMYIHGKDEVTGSNPVGGSIFIIDILSLNNSYPNGWLFCDIDLARD